MGENLLLYLLAVPAVLLSLSFHEMAHAYVSYRLGDPTAMRMGRLTMNPLKHLDPFGTLMLLISMYSGFGFGWAKPVPINPSYYRNYKRGTLLVSLAGPISNLLLAFIFSFPLGYISIRNGISVRQVFEQYGFFSEITTETVLFNICMFFYMINIGLAVFNVIPVPPLDGSKILAAILPERQYFMLMRYENYIGMAFLAIMLLKPGILSTILSPFETAVHWFIMLIVPPLLGLIT